MSEEKPTIHVSMTGENWEVETDKQTLAQAETKEEALEAAREAAQAAQAEKIVVHTSDGMVEKELPTPKSGSNPKV
jgi:predicted amidohydrolase YtcJ